MGGEQTIRSAQSCAQDPREAVEELHAGVAQPDASPVIFFCSSAYDREALAAEIARRFVGTTVVGCTTAGEIGPTAFAGASLLFLEQLVTLDLLRSRDELRMRRRVRRGLLRDVLAGDATPEELRMASRPRMAWQGLAPRQAGAASGSATSRGGRREG